jgi:hypothetical protein
MKKFDIIILSLGISLSVLAQQNVPEPMRGNRIYGKKGIHNGNLVETLFYNNGEVAWWGRDPSGVWPRGTGHSYMDGITPLVVTQVQDENGDMIYICEAGYRELMDVTSEGVVHGWEPRPGYANPNQPYIAMSDNALSWPNQWADKDASWAGFWNGYFGKRDNADQESFFVMDDNADAGHNFYPDSTDHTRRGLALKVGVRGFQWSSTLAEDLIFWHYDITNEGTTQYPKMIFGMYVDVGVGGQFDSNDDNASFDLTDDITYSWDSNGIGDDGWGPTGFCGYAFLESPGNAVNGIDDDGDGEAGSAVITANMILGEIPENGVDDNRNGLVDEAEFHIGFKYADDEDNNGDGFIDEMIDEQRDDGIDNDGDWSLELDDVGADGVSGTGDTGEGDGLPSPGEPHFDATDKDESDQIGLTAFDVFYIGTGVAFYKDEEIWNRISYSHFDTQLQNGNIAFLFGSGQFPLAPQQTERFSVCLIFGENQDDIFRNKQVVQTIYNENYNFARPPEKPKVQAVASDKRVTLYWDDAAEMSYDVFSDPPWDFEGYKIYRSTDPGFLDARIITNAFGEKSFYQPVAQFDIRNSVEGFFPLELQGLQIYMGDNKGLKHTWIDTSVTNGQIYYYAVVSYDRGDAAKRIYPAECTKVIVQDVTGNVRLDVNTIQAIPQAPAAGYEPPGLGDGVEHVEGFGTGDVRIEILDPMIIPDNQTFEVVFDDTSNPGETTYDLINITEFQEPDTIFSGSPWVNAEDYNPVISGMRCLVDDDSIYWDGAATQWISGNCNIPVVLESMYTFDDRRSGYPASFELRFGEPDTTWWFIPRFPVNFSLWDIYENRKMTIAFEEPDAAVRDSLVSVGTPEEFIRIVIIDGNQPREVWRVKFLTPYGNEEPELPENGDVLHIQIGTPFRSGDRFIFTTQAAELNVELAEDSMDEIAVVPNPYVAAARWETQRLLATGRADRRVYFIHLPMVCTIRIFSMSGDHVRTLEHESSMIDGSEAWDLTTKDGLDIAPGVYIFHVDAPDVGKKIGRFALVK